MSSILKITFKDSLFINAFGLNSKEQQKVILYDRSKIFKRTTIKVRNLSITVIDYASKGDYKGLRWFILDYQKSKVNPDDFWIDLDDEPREKGARITFSCINGQYKIIKREITSSE